MGQLGDIDLIDPVQLRDYVMRPVLKYLEPEIPYSISAEQLLLGTAAQESRLKYLHQLGKGPAVGLWQMEPNTHNDIWKNYFYGDQHRGIKTKLQSLRVDDFPGIIDSHEMAGNLYYACAMSRVYYWRIREPLPPPDDPYKMGAYWKKYYNTEAGKGTIEQFEESWKLIEKAIGGTV